MFCGGRHALPLHAAHERRGQAAHGGGILTEGPSIDDRIGRIVVDVNDRCEHQMNSDRPGFARRDLAGEFGVRFPARGGDGHVAREDRRAAAREQRGREDSAFQPTEPRFKV